MIEWNKSANSFDTATFEASDSGMKTVTGLEIKTIYGTNPLRKIYVDARNCNVHANINVSVWSNVYATREGKGRRGKTEPRGSMIRIGTPQVNHPAVEGSIPPTGLFGTASK